MPYSNVVAPDVESCAGPIHVLDSMLVPRGLESVAVANGTNGAALESPALAPGAECVPTAVAAERAGGGGIIAAVEIAAVRFCCIQLHGVLGQRDCRLSGYFMLNHSVFVTSASIVWQ